MVIGAGDHFVRLAGRAAHRDGRTVDLRVRFAKPIQGVRRQVTQHDEGLSA